MERYKRFDVTYVQRMRFRQNLYGRTSYCETLKHFGLGEYAIVYHAFDSDLDSP